MDTYIMSPSKRKIISDYLMKNGFQEDDNGMYELVKMTNNRYIMCRFDIDIDSPEITDLMVMFEGYHIYFGSKKDPEYTSIETLFQIPDKQVQGIIRRMVQMCDTYQREWNEESQLKRSVEPKDNTYQTALPI